MNIPNGFNQMYKELANIPVMPDLYSGIMHSIRRSKNFALLRRIGLAMLITGISSFLFISHVSSSHLSPEVINELGSVRSDLNGENGNVNEELVVYSIYNDDF
jgi:hypothetical protein